MLATGLSNLDVLEVWGAGTANHPRHEVLRSSLQEGDNISFMVEQKPGGKAEAVSVEWI